MIVNPILPGFYPDPSICRVGDDFFMITSSFSLFPGIPVFHSTDLAHWEKLGHALDRPSQLHVTADSLIAGIMAPTLRHHEGTFYIITTNVSSHGNFLVTAADPRGPWSEPVWLPEAPGIDASLFFDDDGRTWITGTRQDPPLDGGRGPQVIWLQELDLATMQLVGPSPTLWGGALKGAASPEAPHLYKKDGWYYLLIAEGGTEHFHAVTVARSRAVDGPYVGFEGNPVLTHRHLGKFFPIGNTGHADLVQTQNGDWYAVMLASRLIDGYHKNLGRETFLCPVTWEDGWPVFSPGTGKVEWTYPDAGLPAFVPPVQPIHDDFDGSALGPDWLFLGTPYEPFHALEGGKLVLRLMPRAMTPDLLPLKRREPGKPLSESPALGVVVRIQEHVAFRISTRLTFTAQGAHETSGMVVLQASNHQFRFERSLKGGRQVLRLIQVTCVLQGRPYLPGFSSRTTEKTLASVDLDTADKGLVLEIRADGQDFGFYHGAEGGPLVPLLENVDGRAINPEEVGGMIGTCLGLFACSNGLKSDNEAAFDWFDYEGRSER